MIQWSLELGNIYSLVMTNSSPWKITMLIRMENHLFLWVMALDLVKTQNVLKPVFRFSHERSTQSLRDMVYD